MNKVLISIKPRYVAEILNHRKTLEIRKSFPKCELPCEVYIYCTKDKNELRLFDKEICEQFKCDCARVYSLEQQKYYTALIGRKSVPCNGKVVAKFALNKIGNFNKKSFGTYEEPFTRNQKELLEKSCLTEKELDDYLKGKKGYAWHIDNLVIFDKPKELKEFKHRIHLCPLRCDNNFVPSFCKDHCKHNKDPERLDVWCDRVDKWCEPLTKAPQSWCYCEVEE